MNSILVDAHVCIHIDVYVFYFKQIREHGRADIIHQYICMQIHMYCIHMYTHAHTLILYICVSAISAKHSPSSKKTVASTVSPPGTTWYDIRAIHIEYSTIQYTYVHNAISVDSRGKLACKIVLLKN